MKVFLQNDELCRVVTVRDGEIDLNHYDRIWDIYTRTEFGGVQVDVCVTGHKTDGERPAIDYDAPVTVEAYDMEGDTSLFECRSPIVQDGYTRELAGITPDELIRQMARIAVPLIPDTRFLRDFSRHDADFVRRTEARNPFLWLVRENGTARYDPARKEDPSGFTTWMDMFPDRCCLFHFDGICLRPVFTQTAREMLEKCLTETKTKIQ